MLTLARRNYLRLSGLLRMILNVLLCLLGPERPNLHDLLALLLYCQQD